MATQTLATQKNYHEMRLIGLFASKYFIIEQQQTLCILDYQQAKQAQLRQQFLQAKQRQQLQQKPLLVPVTIKLDKAQSTVQEKLCALLAEFAFSIEAFGAETIIVRSIPALLIATSIAQLMQVVMTALLQASQPLSTDAILALIAQHGFSPEPLTQQNIADHFAELTTALSRTELDRFSMHITLDTLNKAIPA